MPWRSHRLAEKSSYLREIYEAKPASPAIIAMALARDLRFPAASASFGARFSKRGVTACDMGTSYCLPRLVGVSSRHALDLNAAFAEATAASTSLPAQRGMRAQGFPW